MQPNYKIVINNSLSDVDFYKNKNVVFFHGPFLWVPLFSMEHRIWLLIMNTRHSLLLWFKWKLWLIWLDISVTYMSLHMVICMDIYAPLLDYSASICQVTSTCSPKLSVIYSFPSLSNKNKKSPHASLVCSWKTECKQENSGHTFAISFFNSKSV